MVVDEEYEGNSGHDGYSSGPIQILQLLPTTMGKTARPSTFPTADSEQEEARTALHDGEGQAIGGCAQVWPAR